MVSVSLTTVVSAAVLMSSVDSAAVFAARALQCKIPEALLTAINDEGLGTFTQLAFCTNFTPGSPDDAPLMSLLKKLNGGVDPTAGVASSFRRLFVESYTLAAADLRSRLESRPDAAGPNKLPTPERAFRHAELQKRLGTAVIMESEKEPSDALVDACCSQHDENRLQWIPWEKLSKRDSEITGCKKTRGVIPDAQGILKLVNESEDAATDLSSDLFLRYALQRRALAYDMSALIQYETLEQWHDLMFDRRMREPVSGFGTVSLEQLRAADKFFFEKLGRETRSGCIPNAAGVRPLDALIKKMLDSSEVLMYLMPPQQSKAVGKVNPLVPPKRTLEPDPNSRTSLKKARMLAMGKGSGKGAGKGNGKARGKASGKGAQMPPQLSGGVPKDDQGRNICFGFNLGWCSNPNCMKGRHCCCKKGCFGEDHGFLSCPN